VLRRGGALGRGSREGVLHDGPLSRGGAAWLALALLGMIVTIAFGLWLAQSTHPLPASSPYGTGTQPGSSWPSDRAPATAS